MVAQRWFYSFIGLCLVLFALTTQTSVAQRWNWVVPAVGPSFDESRSLAMFPSGDLMVGGVFSDSLMFGTQQIKSFGNYDVLTARYNSKGRFIGGLNYGSFDADDAQSVVVDKNGNYYVAGSFSTEASIATELIEALDPGSTDMFIAKFNNIGILQWVKVFGSTTYDEGAPYIAVDSLGAVYVAGGFGGTAEFGTRTAISGGKSDAFVAKMSANGDFIWVQGWGSTENDMATAVSVSPNGDRIYVSGTFIGNVSFGNATYESFANKMDFFVRAFDANGGARWAKRIGYSGDDRIIASTTQTDGKLVLTGAISQTTTFDTQTISANGEFESDFFISRITKDGAIELLKRYGGTFEDAGKAVYTDAKGAIFVTGYYDSTTTVEGFIEEAVGGRDGFVTRIKSNGDVDWYRSFGGQYDDEGRGVVVDSKNVPYITGIFDTRCSFEDIEIEGDGFSDIFVAALDCGPSTVLTPRLAELTICEGQDSLISSRFGYPAYEWYVNGQKDATTGYRYRTGTLGIGSYKVYCRVTGFDDCIKNTDTITVTVRAGLPIPTISRNGDVLTCSVPNMKYQWYREGKAINGQTSQTVNIVGDGNYRVQIMDTTGCDRWSENFVVGTTSVFNDETGAMITLYPNPTVGQFTIAGAEGSEVTVTDMLGRLVTHSASISATEVLTIDGSVGTYVVTLRQGRATRTLLITKQ
jgi:hypothetical protein